MSKKNIIIIGSGVDSYIRLLGKALGADMNYIVATTVEEIPKDFKPDLLVFTGGPDVDPSYYMEEANYTSRIDKLRDTEDIKFINKYKKVSKLGICRG
jgi:gamma-glutamyl-gamma-aminobutyrate hydrolase PuuD